MMNRKAVALLSGGLDSTLAVKLMIDQGIDMTAVHFTSVFCNCTPKKVETDKEMNPDQRRKRLCFQNNKL